MTETNTSSWTAVIPSTEDQQQIVQQTGFLAKFFTGLDEWEKKYEFYMYDLTDTSPASMNLLMLIYRTIMNITDKIEADLGGYDNFNQEQFDKAMEEYDMKKIARFLCRCIYGIYGIKDGTATDRLLNFKFNIYKIANPKGSRVGMAIWNTKMPYNKKKRNNGNNVNKNNANTQ